MTKLIHYFNVQVKLTKSLWNSRYVANWASFTLREMCWFCRTRFPPSSLDSARIVLLFSEFGKKSVYCETSKRYIRDTAELTDFHAVWVSFTSDIDWPPELQHWYNCKLLENHTQGSNISMLEILIIEGIKLEGLRKIIEKDRCVSKTGVSVVTC